VPRKQFFFEKKNQKTFTRFDTCQSNSQSQPTEQKFFVSFFQKRNTSLLRWCVGPSPGWYKSSHAANNEDRMAQPSIIAKTRMSVSPAERTAPAGVCGASAGSCREWRNGHPRIFGSCCSGRSTTGAATWWPTHAACRQRKQIKVFWFFSSEKNCFLQIFDFSDILSRRTLRPVRH